MRIVLLTLALLGILASSAWAQSKLALVIGNDAYQEVPRLAKAVNDAEAVADTLAAQGFKVFLAIDADRRSMNRQISRFRASLGPGDTAFLFFAGHGVEIDGENYLLPADITSSLGSDQDFIKAESIALSSLLNRVRGTGAKVTIAVIDACRDNPFATRTGRSIGGMRGLGRIAAPEGTFVIFSAGAGQMALDQLEENEASANSVFTRTLLPKIAEPDLELRDLVKQVRREVRDLALSVNHQQFPAYYDELLGEFYFSNTAASSAHIAAERQSAAMPTNVAMALDVGPERGTTSDLLAERHDEREHVRLVQIELNRLGCDVGEVDGLLGPRTRNAFAQVVVEAGLPIHPADLDAPESLQILRGVALKDCARVVTLTEPEPPADQLVDISGHWTFAASCPLFVRTTGAHIIERIGPRRYQGKATNSFGQSGTTELLVDGRDIEGRVHGRLFYLTFKLRLAPDGLTASGHNSLHCDVEWTRVD